MKEQVASISGYDDVWDRAATNLRHIGVATIDLALAREEAHARSFATAQIALNVAHETPTSVKWIPINADSAHATGYHTAGGENSLSRYNAHREGFVFSDDQTFDVEEVVDFKVDMEGLSASLQSVADQVLRALERQLDIPAGWFQQNLGPLRTSSQFHVKRYACRLDRNPQNSSEPQILLPMHTDPSLISVIVHDVPGRNPSAMGLQYCCPMEKSWRPVPFHGHGVAVVFVGSVLSYMTGNAFPSTKHRVVWEDYTPNERVAATLFVRPQLDAVLHFLPSEHLSREKMDRRKQPVTFSSWISRVSRNYAKKKVMKRPG